MNRAVRAGRGGRGQGAATGAITSRPAEARADPAYLSNFFSPSSILRFRSSSPLPPSTPA